MFKSFCTKFFENNSDLQRLQMQNFAGSSHREIASVSKRLKEALRRKNFCTTSKVPKYIHSSNNTRPSLIDMISSKSHDQSNLCVNIYSTLVVNSPFQVITTRNKTHCFHTIEENMP